MQLHELDSYPALADAECLLLKTADGLQLRTAWWPAPQGQSARGSVFLLHGYREFIEKYYEVIERLREQGFAVSTFDWRGQGLSSRLLDHPLKGYVESYDHFIADAHLVHERHASHLSTPHLLMAHSMGGHLGLRLLQEHPDLFKRAVLSAPMLGWAYPMGAVRVLAKSMVALGQGDRYIPTAGDPDLDVPPNDLTSDLVRLERNRDFWRRTPALILGGPSWRWLYETLCSIRLVMRPDRVSQITAPILLLSAGRDTVVSPSWHTRLGDMNPQFTIFEIPDSKHEILQENDHIQRIVWDQIAAFLEDL